MSHMPPKRRFTPEMVIGHEFVGNIFHGRLRIEEAPERREDQERHNGEPVFVIWIDREGKEFMRFRMSLYNIIDQLNREVLVPREEVIAP